MNLPLALGLALGAFLLSTVLISIAYFKRVFYRHSSERSEDVERGAPEVAKAADEPDSPVERGKGLDQKAVRRFGWAEIVSLTDNFASASVIGEGGFSTVYLARFPPDSSPAALKLHRGGERLRRVFQQELDVLLRASHPHIVRFLGFCDDREEGVLVFEYVPNGSLHDRLHGGGTGLSWARRMATAFGLAEALDYLHERCDPQIVHGDVTASNVLLDDRLQPKLCDFGSALVGFSAAVSLPGRAPVVGSPGYADPHFLRTGLVSRKSDVYGFGVVALELITGAEAFEEGGRPLAARMAPLIKDGRIAELVDPRLGGEYDSTEAAALAELAARCVGVQPSLRPSMAEVLQVMRDQVPSATSAVDDGKSSGVEVL